MGHPTGRCGNAAIFWGDFHLAKNGHLTGDQAVLFNNATTGVKMDLQGYINLAIEIECEVLFWGAERFGKGLTSSFLRNQFTFLRFWAIGGSRKVKIPYDLAICFMKICESFKTKKNAFSAKILITRGKSAMLKTMVLVLKLSEHVGATKWRYH